MRSRLLMTFYANNIIVNYLYSLCSKSLELNLFCLTENLTMLENPPNVPFYSPEHPSILLLTISLLFLGGGGGGFFSLNLIPTEFIHVAVHWRISLFFWILILFHHTHLLHLGFSSHLFTDTQVVSMAQLLQYPKQAGDYYHLFFLFVILKLHFFIGCGAQVCHVCMRKPEDNLSELVFSFYHAGPSDPTQVTKLERNLPFP